MSSWLQIQSCSPCFYNIIDFNTSLQHSVDKKKLLFFSIWCTMFHVLCCLKQQLLAQDYRQQHKSWHQQQKQARTATANSFFGKVNKQHILVIITNGSTCVTAHAPNRPPIGSTIPLNCPQNTPYNESKTTFIFALKQKKKIKIHFHNDCPCRYNGIDTANPSGKFYIGI